MGKAFRGLQKNLQVLNHMHHREAWPSKCKGQMCFRVSERRAMPSSNAQRPFTLSKMIFGVVTYF